MAVRGYRAGSQELLPLPEARGTTYRVGEEIQRESGVRRTLEQPKDRNRSPIGANRREHGKGQSVIAAVCEFDSQTAGVSVNGIAPDRIARSTVHQDTVATVIGNNVCRSIDRADGIARYALQVN